MENTTTYHRRVTCRFCGKTDLRFFLELGPMPLANSFLNSPEDFTDEPFFPLGLHFCENCSLVQILDVIDPAVLFRHYLYVTGTSSTIAAHNAKYAQTIVEMLNLTSSNLVVEVASNDGSLLKCFQPLDVRTLGVDPAVNVAQIARANGVETLAEFFSLATAEEDSARIRPSQGRDWQQCTGSRR